MSNQLPKWVNYVALAKSGAELQATLPVAEFARFSELLVHDVGWVAVDIQFGRDASGFHTLSGFLNAEVSLNCQRCLQTMNSHIRAPVHIALVASEGLVDRVSESFDVEIVQSEVIDLREILENELILFMPISPMHEEGCEFPIGDEKLAEMSTDEPEESITRPNPFLTLSSLKQKLSKKE